MAFLIRSAQVMEEPRILPLRIEPSARLTEARSPQSLGADATASGAMPLPDFAAGLLIESVQPTDEDDDLVAVSPLPPSLPPEVEQALLEERRLAYEDAIKEGFDIGYEKGITEAKESLQAQLSEVEEFLGAVRKAFDTQVSGLEDVIVAAAHEAICKILGTSLHDRNGVVAVVREVMNHVKASEPITIRVAPTDYDLLSQDEGSLQTGHEGMRVTLLPDDRILLGGCLIETSGGNLDGRLETQLQQLTDSILSAKRQQQLDWKDVPHAV